MLAHHGREHRGWQLQEAFVKGAAQHGGALHQVGHLWQQVLVRGVWHKARCFLHPCLAWLLGCLHASVSTFMTPEASCSASMFHVLSNEETMAANLWKLCLHHSVHTLPAAVDLVLDTACCSAAPQRQQHWSCARRADACAPAQPHTRRARWPPAAAPHPPQCQPPPALTHSPPPKQAQRLRGHA